MFALLLPERLPGVCGALPHPSRSSSIESEALPGSEDLGMVPSTPTLSASNRSPSPSSQPGLAWPGVAGREGAAIWVPTHPPLP